MFCKLCMKKIRGANKIKVKGVWQHKSCPPKENARLKK